MAGSVGVAKAPSRPAPFTPVMDSVPRERRVGWLHPAHLISIQHLKRCLAPQLRVRTTAAPPSFSKKRWIFLPASRRSGHGHHAARARAKDTKLTKNKKNSVLCMYTTSNQSGTYMVNPPATRVSGQTQKTGETSSKDATHAKGIIIQHSQFQCANRRCWLGSSAAPSSPPSVPFSVTPR